MSRFRLPGRVRIYLPTEAEVVELLQLDCFGRSKFRWPGQIRLCRGLFCSVVSTDSEGIVELHHLDHLRNFQSTEKLHHLQDIHVDNSSSGYPCSQQLCRLSM